LKVTNLSTSLESLFTNLDTKDFFRPESNDLLSFVIIALAGSAPSTHSIIPALSFNGVTL